MTTKTILLLGGALAAALGAVSSWIRRRLERMRGEAQALPEERPVADVIVQPVPHRGRWPGTASRASAASLAEPAPRRRAGPLGSRADLRRAIVLAAILGPCRARATADDLGITFERRP